MTGKLITFRHLVVAGILCLACASCSDDSDADNRLPDGKYPMMFSGSVDGLTATRATTDNSWTGGEEVAIQVGGTVKKYTAEAGGSLTVVSGGTPFYWQNSTETKAVSAWHSSTYSATLPTTFSIQANQSSIGYQASDFLFAAPQPITYQSGGNSSELIFKHLPVKVVINLKNGDGVTADEVTGATVSIINQATTSGTIGEAGTVMQAASGSTAVTPNVLPSAVSGFQQSVQALLVPQQMQGKKFIKVTIGAGGAAARDYFYTPAGDNAANFEAGQQYTYSITVKKDKLEITQNFSLTWVDNSVESGVPDEVTSFDVKIATGSNVPSLTSVTGLAGSPSNYTITPSGTFSISYRVPNGEGYKGFVAKGTCVVQQNINHQAETFTFTYSNVRSDLLLDYTTFTDLSVGDFYYQDGTWSPLYSNSDSGNPCIGVVCWIGDDALREDPLLRKQHPTCTHGLVLALNDASNDKRKWNDNQSVSIQTWVNGKEQYRGINLQEKNKMCGYSNTLVLNAYNTEKGNNDNSFVLPCEDVKNYAEQHTTPENSSGWYFPSAKELIDVCWGRGNNSGKSGRDLWNISIRVAGGKTLENDACWTSSEVSAENAWYVHFNFGTLNSFPKNGHQIDVRPLLAF